MARDKEPGLLPVPELAPPAPWRIGSAEWTFRNPLLMGVINVTPDSFSDGGRYLEPKRAFNHGSVLETDGADILDVGGASSHPQASPVDTETELARVAPVVEDLLRETRLLVSIDTRNPVVAEQCLKLGAHLINDVSGLVRPEMARVAARHGVPLVITHNGWALPARPPGQGFMESVIAFFRERLKQCSEVGVERVILDPGYGFGKTLEENLTLLRSLNMLRQFKRPVLICTSRKGSLGRIVDEPDPADRLGATVASSLFAAFQGANLIRVHDVKPLRQALTTWSAIKGAEREG
jgi:dihydropteroate synthase